jgi:hypothetical protein
MKTTITISEKTYKNLVKLKMQLSLKRGKPLTWDEFFEELNLKTRI